MGSALLEIQTSMDVSIVELFEVLASPLRLAGIQRGSAVKYGKSLAIVRCSDSSWPLAVVRRSAAKSGCALLVQLGILSAPTGRRLKMLLLLSRVKMRTTPTTLLPLPPTQKTRSNDRMVQLLGKAAMLPPAWGSRAGHHLPRRSTSAK